MHGVDTCYPRKAKTKTDKDSRPSHRNASFFFVYRKRLSTLPLLEDVHVSASKNLSAKKSIGQRRTAEPRYRVRGFVCRKQNASIVSATHAGFFLHTKTERTVDPERHRRLCKQKAVSKKHRSTTHGQAAALQTWICLQKARREHRVHGTRWWDRRIAGPPARQRWQPCYWRLAMRYPAVKTAMQTRSNW